MNNILVGLGSMVEPSRIIGAIGKAKILILVLILVLLLGLSYFNKFYFQQSTSIIHSDLILPTQSALLERENIIREIDGRLKKKSGIKTIALTGIVGIGGAGKTTLARYYGSQMKNTSVVWEFNAETKGALLQSMRELSYRLADNKELRDQLLTIVGIKEPDIQEKQLLGFLKSQLKARSGWLLIYDNLESIAEFLHFLPQDSDIWGDGRVIITTRNTLIGENNFIDSNNVLHISELSQDEMLELFTKILHNKSSSDLTKEQRRKFGAFLQHIPPFPLDVSVSAFSIKNTNVTLDQYLKYVREYTAQKHQSQIELLEEVTDYTNTRYGIVSSTLDRLSRVEEHYSELLFLICSLDSQNIPHELLEGYKLKYNIGNFIYNLRKNGLLLRESYSNLARENKIISIHRSTQEIGNVYLRNILDESELDRSFQGMVRSIYAYYDSNVPKDNVNEIISLIPHIQSVIHTVKATTIKNRAKYLTRLTLLLAEIENKWNKNLLSARYYFKEAIRYNKISNVIPRTKYTILLKDLAFVCNQTNFPHEAIKYSNESMEKIEKSSDSPVLIAELLQIIGSAYRRLNKFEESESYFLKSIAAYDQSKTEGLNGLIAETYTQLNQLYICNYINKVGIARFQDYSLKALEALNGYKLYNQVGEAINQKVDCNIARQQWKHSEFFLYHSPNYSEAKKWLESAEYVRSHNCPNNLYLKGRIAGAYGAALLRENRLNEAEERLSNSIRLIITTLGQRSAWVENVALSELKNRKENFVQAYANASLVLDLKALEQNNLHNLRFYTAHYHGAFALYKLGRHKESIEHFKSFIVYMHEFCKNFLDSKQFDILEQEGIFVIPASKNQNAIELIQTYLQRSLRIFTSIYGEDHLFIKDYVRKNLEN